MIPYSRQNLTEAEVAAVLEVLESGWIARGPRARELEERCAERLGASHAVTCSNGSAALEIALRALGIGPGDDVIVPTLTWVATGMAVLQVGARPVFCDVDAITHDATPATVQAAWTPRTRAVIAVDFAGVPAPIDALRALCDARGAYLIEDAAHAFGARFDDGRPVGRDGAAHVTTFSFHPAKTITTAEGGLLTTDDPELGERLRRVRSGGLTREFEGSRGRWDVLATDVGGNYHMTELSAALGLVQLQRLDALLDLRRQAFERLGQALAPLADRLILPRHPAGSCHNLFIVELRGGSRDASIAKLREEGVAAHVHYPLLHRQPVFGPSTDEPDGSTEHAGQGALFGAPTFPVAERYVERALSLPLFAGITDGQIRHVALALERALPVSAPSAA